MPVIASKLIVVDRDAVPEVKVREAIGNQLHVMFQAPLDATSVRRFGVDYSYKISQVANGYRINAVIEIKPMFWVIVALYMVMGFICAVFLGGWAVSLFILFSLMPFGVLAINQMRLKKAVKEAALEFGGEKTTMKVLD